MRRVAASIGGGVCVAALLAAAARAADDGRLTVADLAAYRAR